MGLPDIYPGARWEPLYNWQNRRLASPTIGNRLFTGHTIVGYFQSAINMFRANGYNGVHSTFVLGGSPGQFVQLMGLTRAAAADYTGSSFTISVEAADHGPEFPSWSGSDVPDYTPYQKEELIKLCVWLIRTGYCHPHIASSSCERGLGWHRLGVPGYKPEECPALSKALYKACPGDRRIASLKNYIFPTAIRIATNTGEFIMDAEATAAFAALNARLDNLPLQVYGLILGELNKPASAISAAVVSRTASGCNRAHLDQGSRTSARLNQVRDEVIEALQDPPA